MTNENPANIDFGQLISNHFGSLTKSEKRIANYLRKNQEECAFIAAGELADRLGLSEATIVRFARTLGFSSYPAMRSVLQQAFRNRVTHSERLRSRLEELREDGDVFEKVTITEIDYLTLALQTIDRKALRQAVDLLAGRKRIYVFGTGPSTILANMLSLRLTRFGKQVIPLTATGREMLEPLLLMEKDDLLFAIGFFDVNPMLHIVLDQANKKDCPVIFLTDTLESVLGPKTDVILAAKRGPVSSFHSLVVPMTVINTILLEVAREIQRAVLENLDELDQLREKLKNFRES
jgi:DNA-binding MurR/RpiR family transcriptional regulator